jgi:hypothetical protein
MNWIPVDVEPQMTEAKKDLIKFLGRFKRTETLQKLIGERVFSPEECARIKEFMGKHLTPRVSSRRNFVFND